MASRPSVLSILLLTADPDLQTQYTQELAESHVTVVQDWSAASQVVHKRKFDVVVLETRRNDLAEFEALRRAVDPTRTCLIAGSRASLRRALGSLTRGNGMNGKSPGRPAVDFGLEDYMASKLADFVKGMKNGSARNLHPMLIKAVERPLITLALRETNGNQIKAATLLGVNRNTLRKRITEFRIPVKREKARKG